MTALTAGRLPAEWLGETRTHGPAHPATRLSSVACRALVKPAILGGTLVGLTVNRVAPQVLQRTSLAWIDAPRLLAPPVSGVRVRRVQLPTCRAEWLQPRPRRTSAAIIYFHGSAFIVGGLNSHRPFASRLAALSDVPVLNVAYSMRPKGELEDAIQQGVDAYHHAVSRGADPRRIILAGDSAGGFMAAMVAIRLRDLGLPQPAGQVLLSPVTDNHMESKLDGVGRWGDAMFPRATLQFINHVYIRRNGTVEADAGPAQLELAGLAPFLIHVGSGEVLRNDAELLTERLRASGVHAELDIYDQAPHVFQLTAPVNPDANAAVRSIVDFVQRTTQTSARATSMSTRTRGWIRPGVRNVIPLGR
ncbi:MAG TPA: alpha/beta hydrolase [Nocardioidaceae bacterium]|nr:alpha/beta hydrolase [Nocardioidaceae bacterium]